MLPAICTARAMTIRRSTAAVGTQIPVVGSRPMTVTSSKLRMTAMAGITKTSNFSAVNSSTRAVAWRSTPAATCTGLPTIVEPLAKERCGSFRLKWIGALSRAADCWRFLQGIHPWSPSCGRAEVASLIGYQLTLVTKVQSRLLYFRNLDDLPNFGTLVGWA